MTSPLSLQQALLIRYPTVIVTSGSSSDPFSFVVDSIFQNTSSLSDAGNITILSRDVSDYINVDIGYIETQSYPITTYMNSYTSSSFSSIFNINFTSL